MLHLNALECFHPFLWRPKQVFKDRQWFFFLTPTKWCSCQDRHKIQLSTNITMCSFLTSLGFRRNMLSFSFSFFSGHLVVRTRAAGEDLSPAKPLFACGTAHLTCAPPCMRWDQCDTLVNVKLCSPNLQVQHTHTHTALWCEKVKPIYKMSCSICERAGGTNHSWSQLLCVWLLIKCRL